jgi:DNA-binding transcriptional LysR family regulator
MTPAALTARVKGLEEALGVALFTRLSTGLKLNAAGEAALTHIDAIERRVREMLQAMEDVRLGRGGRLSVAVVSTAKYFAPRLIADFARRFPGVDITLTVGNRLDTVRALRRMDIDVAIMGRPPAQVDLVSEAFGDHPMMIIAPPDHPLVGRHDISKSVIANEPFLLREEGSGTRTVFEEFFDRPVNRHTHFGIEIGSNETIKQGVMAGLGLALLSAHTVAFEVEMGRLAILDVSGLPIIRKWFIVHHAEKAVLPAIRAFWDFTLENGARHLPILGQAG